MTSLSQYLIIFASLAILKADFWDVFDGALDCPAVDIDYGGVKTRQMWLTIEAHFWCNHDYILVGEDILVCSLGHWDNEPPICVPKGSWPTGFRSCGINNGGCHQVCASRDYCACYAGFHLSDDMKSCFDIDECLEYSSQPPCQGICVNTLGSFHCHCPVGTYLQSDGKSCIDINECEVNNFNCSHFCANVKGGAFCVCPENLILGQDNKTCVAPSSSNNSQDMLHLMYEKIIAMETKLNQQESKIEDALKILKKLVDYKMNIMDNYVKIPCESQKSLDQVERDIKRGLKLTEFLIRECSLNNKTQDINLSEQLSLLGNDTKEELHVLGTQLKNVSQLVENLTKALHGPHPENLFPLHK